MKDLSRNIKETELLLIVHPFSTQRGFYSNSKKTQDIHFSKEEREYFKKIKKVIQEDERDVIITQPYWDYSSMKSYIQDTKLSQKREILVTQGNPNLSDSPEPLTGWKELIKRLRESGKEKIIICGSQLGVWQTIFSKDYFGYCVGVTYNLLNKKIKNKKIELRQELCLVYNYK